MSQTKPDPATLGYRPCVGIMVLNSANRVWVGQRADNVPEGGGPWWQMPQGGIDEDEDPRAAAIRELREETAITSVEILAETPDWLTYDLPEHLIGKLWGGRYRGQKQKWFAVRFLGSEAEIDIGEPGRPNTEFIAWHWCAPEKLPTVIIPFKRAVYTEVLRIFRPILGGQ
ncbi:MAG TPA: RNA pyrophosphohydrolase [Hyphomicrobium sp.]|nr:RNA pyrophosphohydrolase [Hyphomicrobium sp.]